MNVMSVIKFLTSPTFRKRWAIERSFGYRSTNQNGAVDTFMWTNTSSARDIG
jgi:hypothetical protein